MFSAPSHLKSADSLARRAWWFFLLLIPLVFDPVNIYAWPSQDQTEIPALTGPVVDTVGVMSRAEAEALTRLSWLMQKRYRAYLQVLVVSDLMEESIEEYSIRVAEKWKLGESKSDLGELLVVAVQNKKVRIEVGRGLEGTLTDLVSKRIIREEAVPFFRQGKMGSGILAVQIRVARLVVQEVAPNDKENFESELSSIFGGQIDRENPNERDSVDEGSFKKDFDILILLAFLFFIIVFNFFGGGGRGFRRGPRSWGGGWPSGGGGWSSGGGSSWSGGGGGGFGGGGASGDW